MGRSGIYLACWGVLPMMKAIAMVMVPVMAAVAACGQSEIEVSTTPSSDYNHGALRGAIDKFVADGRTPEAYGELAQTVRMLRSGMDRSIADDAELKLIVLALAPVQAVAAKPMAEQVEVLALTVWPTLLAPEIRADEVLVRRDAHAAEMYPKPDETPRGYLLRLCGGPLASECKQVVPEYQGAVLAALATRRATERGRNAVSACMLCKAEPGWHEAIRTWESLDRQANGGIHDLESDASPDNWPVAGNAAQNSSEVPELTAIWREAQINATGEVVIGGQRYGATQRIDALRELRGNSSTITLHLRPELSLAQAKALIADAKKSGASKIAVVARAPHYPWDRKIYWLSDAGKIRPNLRPTDSLQLLLHTIDHVAGPGAIARVD